MVIKGEVDGSQCFVLFLNRGSHRTVKKGIKCHNLQPLIGHHMLLQWSN